MADRVIFELEKYFEIFSSPGWIYKTTTPQYVVDLVKVLLRTSDDVYVSWVDDGDVGMKMGGSCTGTEFLSGASEDSGESVEPWGEYHYQINAVYKGKKVNVTPIKNGVIVYLNGDCSEEQKKAFQEEIPKMLGWEG